MPKKPKPELVPKVDEPKKPYEMTPAEQERRGGCSLVERADHPRLRCRFVTMVKPPSFPLRMAIRL